MKKLLILAACAAFLLCTYTDWKCVEACLEKGYDYQLCAKKCSY